jgi:hypothetical protein
LFRVSNICFKFTYFDIQNFDFFQTISDEDTPYIKTVELDKT